MECVFIPEFSSASEQLIIKGEEFRHLWALRLREGELVMLTNGEGICGIARIHRVSKNEAEVSIIEILPDYGENKVRVGLAVGILDSRERMEFALEKSVELGVTDFYPITCEFSQKQTVSTERLQSKAIAAMKQCKRSRLPTIHNPMSVKQLLENTSEWEKVIIGDTNGIQISNTVGKKSTLVVIGTEGGFSPKELVYLKEDPRTILISLGNRRLRAETASIVALSLLI